jgi:CheY-specific phosphatase CheX
MVEAWREELSAEATFREAEPVAGLFTTAGLTAAISVVGRVEGYVFYEFPEVTSIAVAAAIGAVEKRVLDTEIFSIIQRFLTLITP